MLRRLKLFHLEQLSREHYLSVPFQMSLGRLLTLVLAYQLDAWDSNLGSKFTSFRLDLGQLSPTLTNFFSKIEKKVSYQFFCHIEFFSKPIVDEFFSVPVSFRLRPNLCQDHSRRLITSLLAPTTPSVKNQVL